MKKDRHKSLHKCILLYFVILLILHTLVLKEYQLFDNKNRRQKKKKKTEDRNRIHNFFPNQMLLFSTRPTC